MNVLGSLLTPARLRGDARLVRRQCRLHFCATALPAAAVVAFQSYYSSVMGANSSFALYLVIVILPVSLSVAIAIDNRFRMSTQSKARRDRIDVTAYCPGLLVGIEKKCIVHLMVN